MNSSQTFNKQDYLYTALFCEENIWQLCRSLTSTGIPTDALNVLFLSNNSKDIVVFNQQFIDSGQAISYDYHVILKYRPDDDEALVFDFDTHLPFPVDWNTYQQASFPNPADLPPGQRMMVREVAADEFLRCFTSDRSHMAHLPASEHPDYDCIHASDPQCAVDLKDYWQMDRMIRGTSRVYPYTYVST